MPTVFLNYSDKFHNAEALEPLKQLVQESLPQVVSDHLSCEEDDLVRGNVKVHAVQNSPLDWTDKDIEIVVLSTAHESRLANIDERKDRILRAVEEFCTRHFPFYVEVFIYVFLGDAACGKFSTAK